MIQYRDIARPRPPSTRPTTAARTSPRLLVGAITIVLLLVACSPAPTAAPPTSTPAASPPSASPPGTSPSPFETASPEPSPEDTGPAAAACTAADLKVSHGLVEGTAGSRNTEVILVTAIPCAIPAWPAFGIRDSDGAALIGGIPGGGGLLTIQPEASYASGVQLSNWCSFQPAHPLTLELRLGQEAVAVTGGPFPDEGDMPPCTAGATPMLIGTAWAPSS